MNFRGRPRRPALGAFLRDIDGKIAGIPQCRALGTTLLIISCQIWFAIFRYLYSVPTPDDAAIAATLSPHDLQHSNVETFFGSDDSSEGK